MLLYILNDSFERESVVDVFESLIWTERYSTEGDFELTLLSTAVNRSIFSLGTVLAMEKSNRMMLVETTEVSTESDGKNYLKVTGRSAESLLMKRINRSVGLPAGTAVIPELSLTGLPQEIMYKLVEDYCINNETVPADVIPLLTSPYVTQEYNIPFPLEPTTMTFSPGSVFDSLKAVSDAYNLGFYIERYVDEAGVKLGFGVYTGNNRTAGQDAFAPVIFSPTFENMTSTSQLNTNETHYNVAYVLSQYGSRIVYSADADDSTVGADRKVMVVTADDISNTPGPVLQAALEKRGQEALAANRQTQLIDGELTENSAYIYGQDYFLGDLVEMRATDGTTSQMRVKEQIFVSDEQGDRAYPTLEAELFITPGSWFSFEGNVIWEEAVGTWSEK